MKLDFQRFGKLMRQARGDLSHREYSKGAPFSAATWFRTERGMAPSLANFVAICDWVQIDPGVAIRQMRKP